MLTCENLSLSLPWSIGGNMSIWLALVLQELPETTAKLCGFSLRAFRFCIRTRGGRSSVLRSASTRLWSGEMEPDRGKCETNSGTRGRGSDLRHGPFGTSGSGIILICAAGAPIGKLVHRWLTSEVCSSKVLVPSGAVTVVPTVPGAVPVEQCTCWLIVLVTSGALTVVPTVPRAVPLENSPPFSEIEG